MGEIIAAAAQRVHLIKPTSILIEFKLARSSVPAPDVASVNAPPAVRSITAPALAESVPLPDIAPDRTSFPPVVVIVPLLVTPDRNASVPDPTETLAELMKVRLTSAVPAPLAIRLP